MRRSLISPGIAFQELGDGGKAEHYYKLAARADKNDSNAAEQSRYRRICRSALRQSDQVLQAGISKGNAAGDHVHQSRLRLLRHQGISESHGGFRPGAGDRSRKCSTTRAAAGTVLQQRSSADPASLHFMLAKSYAKIGDAERAARYLKMARDEGYKEFQVQP